MQIELQAANDIDATGQLYDWLRREDRLRGRIHMAYADLPADAMGGIADTIAVAVGTGGMGTVAASAIVAWLSQRNSDLTVSVTRRPDGVTLKVEARQAKDPEALLRALAGFLDGEAAGPEDGNAAS